MLPIRVIWKSGFEELQHRESDLNIFEVFYFSKLWDQEQIIKNYLINFVLNLRMIEAILRIAKNFYIL